jgi:hypothetical protein
MKYPYIQRVFEYLCDKRRTRWLSVRDFTYLVQKVDLLTEFLTERDTHLIFNLSLSTSVDELTDDKHMRMNLLEFVVAIALLAEKVSPTPVGEAYARWTLV